MPTIERELQMTKISADTLTFSDSGTWRREDDGLGGHQSNPAPRSDKINSASASPLGETNGDARERLLRHLIRLHGLVG